MSAEKKSVKTSDKTKKTSPRKKAPAKKKGATAVEHTLSGDLSLRRANEVKQEFLDLVSKDGDVTLSFKDVDDVDLSFIQILCSTHRSLVNSGKKMAFVGLFPENFKQLINESGLDEHVGCSFDSKIGCPWLQKDN